MSDNNIPKKTKTVLNIAMIYFAILAIALTVLFILTNAVKFAVLTVICIIALIFVIASKKNPYTLISAHIGSIVGVTAIILTLLSMPSLSINSHAKWKYPFQRFYVDCYQNVKEPEWFPDFLDDVQGDYSFSYMPSLMQGSGHYRVSFAASHETVLEYEKEFSKQALYVIDASEFRYGNTYTVYGKDGNSKGDIFISIPEAFGGAGTVYVIDTNLDWNHNHSAAVIIDKKSGRIGLIQEG